MGDRGRARIYGSFYGWDTFADAKSKSSKPYTKLHLWGVARFLGFLKARSSLLGAFCLGMCIYTAGVTSCARARGFTRACIIPRPSRVPRRRRRGAGSFRFSGPRAQRRRRQVGDGRWVRLRERGARERRRGTARGFRAIPENADEVLSVT